MHFLYCGFYLFSDPKSEKFMHKSYPGDGLLDPLRLPSMIRIPSGCSQISPDGRSSGSSCTGKAGTASRHPSGSGTPETAFWIHCSCLP